MDQLKNIILVKNQNVPLLTPNNHFVHFLLNKMMWSTILDFIVQDIPATINHSSALDPLEVEVIDLFVGLMKLLGLPRSLGEIYGLIYISEKPLSLDDLVERLSLSKGSASQGLRTLRQFGAIRQTYIAGERREFFIAETELKKLVLGFLDGQLLPHLQSARERLTRLNQIIDNQSAGATGSHQLKRVKKLRQWHERAGKLAPILSRVLD